MCVVAGKNPIVKKKPDDTLITNKNFNAKIKTVRRMVGHDEVSSVIFGMIERLPEKRSTMSDVIESVQLVAFNIWGVQ